MARHFTTLSQENMANLHWAKAIELTISVLGYFHAQSDVDKALDVIEVCFMYIDTIARRFDPPNRQGRGITQDADSAIAELNERFRRAGVGYRFEGGKILRVRLGANPFRSCETRPSIPQ